MPGPVLVAEDDRDTRELIATALRSKGYRVLEVSDGDQLQAQLDGLLARDGKIGEGSLTAVITDIRMPGQSPFEALASLIRSGSPVPFIVITALSDDYTQAEAARLGVSAFFHKPFDPMSVQAAIAAFEELAAVEEGAGSVDES
jgi:CheY-like chemotaxis protein